MKKLFTSFLALMLVFSASIAFTACGKKGKTKIGFESGNYSCSVNQDSLVLNDNLTEAELQDYLDVSSVSGETNYATFQEFIADLPELFGNTYFKINTYDIQMYNYEITEKMFIESSITIDTYSFKKNVLTFVDQAGGNYKITKNEDNSLTLTLTESYDFGTFETEDIKTIYTVEITLNIETESNPIVYPTPELNLYEDKTITKKYKLTSFSNLNDYFSEYAELFAIVGMESVSDYQDYLTKNSHGTLILFNDYTLYYEANIDMGAIFDSMMSDLEMDLDISTRIGYLYSYEPASQENTYNVMDDLSQMFMLQILNNGSNISVTIEDIFTSTSYTLNFTEVQY